MALFVLFCVDKPNSLELRMATRQAHLAYAGQFAGVTKLGGPLINDAGEMAGSLIILDVEDKAAAQAFTDNDPYSKAGLFERVDIAAFRATLGSL
jgi:hypothetical protein